MKFCIVCHVLFMFDKNMDRNLNITWKISTKYKILDTFSFLLSVCFDTLNIISHQGVICIFVQFFIFCQPSWWWSRVGREMKKYSPSSGFEQKVMLLTWAWLVRVGVFRSSQSASDSPSVNMEDTRVQRKEAEKRWGGGENWSRE